MMRAVLWRSVVEAVSWCVAVAWIWRVADAVRHLPEVPDLSTMERDLGPHNAPTLTVVVPARNEEAHLAATLDALMAQQYPWLQVVAVDDRSTDRTGAIVDEYAARFPERLHPMRITELPEGWLGKTFALTLATDNTQSEFLLFTDADVLLSPSLLRRALAYAEAELADHLVVMPTPLVESRGEGIMLGFFQIIGLWAARAWRIADPKARRDVVGAGAFNLIRREALEEIGGLAPQRLAILEDVTIGLRFKAAGMRQRIAFAPGLVLIHWAPGALGLIGVMTKNLFAAFDFRPLLLLAACAWIMLFCLLPIAGLFWWRTLIPAVLTLCCVGAAYRTLSPSSLIDARYGWLSTLR